MKITTKISLIGLVLLFVFAFGGGGVFAADFSVEQRLADLEAYVANTQPAGKLVGNPGPGHNGFMMVSAALVLFMTLPGLALFYGGLVRSKNVLSILGQCLGIAGLTTLLWGAFGYSFVFAKGTPFLGGFDFAFLRGVTSVPNFDYSYWVSQNVFSMYQLMFAIITPALIIGAVAERMKFSAVLLFVAGWLVLVYFPVAHMMWGIDGWMNGVWNKDAAIKSLDFAGGIVVHVTSGWSALLLCVMLGKRVGYGREPMPPHSMVLCMVGTGMLWVGWYGFNAGSAVAADGIAASAFTATTIAGAIASFVWGMLEWAVKGKPSVLGFCSGAVAGLAFVTPGAGFVSPSSAFVIGIVAGAVPFFACTDLKMRLKYDDALDVFGVHAVSGTLGSFLVGFFASEEVNPNLLANLSGIVGKTLWLEQAKAIGVALAISVVGTAVLGYAIKMLVGLRPAEDEEREGLDETDHGETGYNL